MVTFPNVPNLPGVPPLPRDPVGALLDTLGLVTRDSVTLPDAVDPVWGVFDKTGYPLCDWDSVIDVDFLGEYRASSYPVEKGGFQQYNKVAEPFEVKVTLAKSGTEAERSEFLAVIADALKSLNLYTVITPERSFENATLTHQDFKRTVRGGVSMILASLWFEEIRETVETAFSNTKAPSGAAATNVGTVQAKPVAGPTRGLQIVVT